MSTHSTSPYPARCALTIQHTLQLTTPSTPHGPVRKPSGPLAPSTLLMSECWKDLRSGPQRITARYTPPLVETSAASVLSERGRDSQRATGQNPGTPTSSPIPDSTKLYSLGHEVKKRWNSPGLLSGSDNLWCKHPRSILLSVTAGWPTSVIRPPSGRAKQALIDKQWITPITLQMQPHRSNFLKLLLLIFIFFWLRRKWLRPKVTIWFAFSQTGSLAAQALFGAFWYFFFFFKTALSFPVPS